METPSRLAIGNAASTMNMPTNSRMIAREHVAHWRKNHFFAGEDRKVILIKYLLKTYRLWSMYWRPIKR